MRVPDQGTNWGLIFFSSEEELKAGTEKMHNIVPPGASHDRKLRIMNAPASAIAGKKRKSKPKRRRRAVRTRAKARAGWWCHAIGPRRCLTRGKSIVFKTLW